LGVVGKHEDDSILKNCSWQEGQSFTVPKNRWKYSKKKGRKCFLITNFLRMCQNSSR